MKFLCNLPFTTVKGPKGLIHFQNSIYETNDNQEIKFLKSYGARQGCVITPLEDDMSPEISPVTPPAVYSGEANDKYRATHPKNPKGRPKRK